MEDKNISTYQQCIGCTIDKLVEEVQHIVNLVVKNSLIIFRVKDSEILRKKMQLKNVQNVFLIDDVYGICIIVESIKEVYLILEKISQTFPGYLDHDYFKKPKNLLVLMEKYYNFYSSLHTKME